MYTHTNGMKDIEDSSKKLVGGEFESKGKVVSRKAWFAGWTVLAVSIVLLLYLLGLTILRDVQLSALRKEMDQLTAKMATMEATVKGLNQSVTNIKQYDDMAHDRLYTDVDEDLLVEDSMPIGKPKGVMHKLDEHTVVIDDSDDLYDEDEDEGSGDFYDDTSRDFVMKLDPDTDSTLHLNSHDSVFPDYVQRLKDRLNENPEAEISWDSVKRDVVTESDERLKRSVAPDSPLDSVDEFAAPRSFLKNQEARTHKRSEPSNLRSAKLEVAHVSRTTRNSDDEIDGQRRSFIAAHFHGNTSHLSTDLHDHYKGNGLVQLAYGAHHDVWYPAAWTLPGAPRPTLRRNGHIAIHQTGVYLVYVQIYYVDSHDQVAWVLHRTNPNNEGRDTLLQCAQSAHSPEPQEKTNSCFSASALLLRKGDILAVRNTGGGRHSVMQKEKSFIGLVQLADAVSSDDDL